MGQRTIDLAEVVVKHSRGAHHRRPAGAAPALFPSHPPFSFLDPPTWPFGRGRDSQHCGNSLPAGRMERAELRDLVLFLLGFVYLVAFTSVFLQADGLFGVNGLEPVHKVAGRVSQERAGVLWWARPAGTGADEWLDMIAVAGIVASVLVTAGFAYIPLLALCWLLYLSILLVGQTFLSFQWDIFLLEVGGLALLYAPASPLSAKRKPSAVSIMCLRWCLFKIMLMSGVVKIQARCPAWMGLHALHYHYATQCIPTPLSWYAHQLPNFVQKLSVMGTLLFEIPGSFLIIAPWREARVCAACVNIFLMAVIALTGNYTFFNVLTATLCIPLLESAASSCAPPSCAPTTAGGFGDDRGRASPRGSAGALSPSGGWHP